MIEFGIFTIIDGVVELLDSTFDEETAAVLLENAVAEYGADNVAWDVRYVD